MEMLRFQVEITTSCNSSCRGCGRFLGGTDTINPNIIVGSNGNMRRIMFESIMEVGDQIGEFFFTGAYGDAILHPEFPDFLSILHDSTPADCAIVLETNGGLHSPEWWADLAKRSSKLTIRFGIDGTDNESHGVYRRGVVFDKVIANAKAFIAAGGTAIWEMIELGHNRHLKQECESMAKDLGFARFKYKNSRVINQVSYEGKVSEDWKATFDQNQKGRGVSSVVHDPENKEMISKVVNHSFKSQDEYDNFCDIECRWEAQNKFSIDYDGVVSRCCYFSDMYHASPKTDQLLNGIVEADHKIKEHRASGYQWYLDKYGETFNHLTHHSISDIINHEFFGHALPDSLNNPGNINHNPRILSKCPKHCGEIANAFIKAKKDHIQ